MDDPRIPSFQLNVQHLTGSSNVSRQSLSPAQPPSNPFCVSRADKFYTGATAYTNAERAALTRYNRNLNRSADNRSSETSHFPLRTNDSPWLVRGHGMKQGTDAVARLEHMHQAFRAAYPTHTPGPSCGVSASRVPSKYIGSPYVQDRFFFQRKRSMENINAAAVPLDKDYASLPLREKRRLALGRPVALRTTPMGQYPTRAELQVYERRRQRQALTLRPSHLRLVPAHQQQRAGVVQSRIMLDHIQQGREILEQKERQDRVGPNEPVDLLSDILLYDIPGVRAMHKDYTPLVDSREWSELQLQEDQDDNRTVSSGYFGLSTSDWDRSSNIVAPPTTKDGSTNTSNKKV
jgi:hypothetical protein